MTVKIYSTATCPWCLLAKKYFYSKRIPFENIDVGTDQEKAEEMVKISGQMGVPVIVIGDEIIVGFDQAKVEEILKKQNN